MRKAIFGIGVDIVKTARVADLARKFPHRFLKRYLHPSEISEYQLRSGEAADHFLASRWAAKEAVQKAVSVKRLLFPEIVVSKVPGSPRPEVHFVGKAKEITDSLSIVSQHISISHDGDYCVAYVIVEKSEPN